MARKYKPEEIFPDYKPPVTPPVTPAPVTPPKDYTTFNPNGSTTIVRGGEPITLNKEEYKQYNSKIMNESLVNAQTSPGVAKLLQIEENQRLKKTISDNLKRGATISQITQELLQQEAQKQAPQIAQDSGLLTEQSSDITPMSTTENKLFPKESFPNKVAQTFGINTPQKNLLGATELITKPIGKIYDFASSILHDGKGIEQREAEKTLSQLDTEINQDLSLVSSGLKNSSDVKRKIADARSALVRLDNSIKGLNKVNLRYFILHGEDVRTEILNYQDQLRDYEVMLQQAQAEYLLSQAKANYGIQ